MPGTRPGKTTLPRITRRKESSFVVQNFSSNSPAASGETEGPAEREGEGEASPQFAIAGSRTFACAKAGITSEANHSSCSRHTAFGTPTDKLTETRSRPG